MKLATMIKTTVVGLLGATIWATAPGCGPSVGSYCNKVCDCTGCSESELDDCVDSVEDARKVADEEGCSGEFDAALSCASSELSCEDDQVKADGCESEAEDLFKCSPKITVGFGGNACQIYADKVYGKYEACGVTIDTGDSTGEDIECTAEMTKQAACLTPCIEQVPCECIDPELISAGACTQDLAQPYSDCITSCSI